MTAFQRMALICSVGLRGSGGAVLVFIVCLPFLLAAVLLWHLAKWVTVSIVRAMRSEA